MPACCLKWCSQAYGGPGSFLQPPPAPPRPRRLAPRPLAEQSRPAPHPPGRAAAAPAGPTRSAAARAAQSPPERRGRRRRGAPPAALAAGCRAGGAAVVLASWMTAGCGAGAQRPGQRRSSCSLSSSGLGSGPARCLVDGHRGQTRLQNSLSAWASAILPSAVPGSIGADWAAPGSTMATGEYLQGPISTAGSEQRAACWAHVKRSSALALVTQPTNPDRAVQRLSHSSSHSRASPRSCKTAPVSQQPCSLHPPSTTAAGAGSAARPPVQAAVAPLLLPLPPPLPLAAARAPPLLPPRTRRTRQHAGHKPHRAQARLGG